MADLTNFEKRRLEKLLQMSGGYVLDFSNATFDEFVFDSTQREIYDAKYDQASGSKAHRLRAFIGLESNHLVGKLLSDLIRHRQELIEPAVEADLLAECQKTAQRLLQDTPVADLEAIVPNADAREFDLLARAVRESIERHEPEAGLDRLHTFVLKFIRVLAEGRGVVVDQSRPLHALFGQYLKQVRSEGLIQSEMAERILKSTISTLEAFNTVRNDQSLAHANPVLGYDESILIFNHVASLVRFLRGLESTAPEAGNDADSTRDEWLF